MARLRVKWRMVFSSDQIRRSSQVLAINETGKCPTLGIFGGELKPREPVDARLQEIPLLETPNLITRIFSPAPSPRVGSASTTLNDTTYLFSGRGGAAMTPIEEHGSLWALSRLSNEWSLIQPGNPEAPFPQARSYHALTSDKRDTIYLHAGCPEKGRLSDLWAFQISTRRWIELSDAPDPPRGGTSITFCSDTERLYRMNGFDGKTELGGSLDVYNPETDCWSSVSFTADGKEGPEARSVSCLLCLRIEGRPWLLTLFGERDPSALGHAGAGKMLGDVWAWDVKGEVWVRVEDGDQEKPVPRGWFAAGVLGENEVVVQGGLSEGNERLGDVLVGQFDIAE